MATTRAGPSLLPGDLFSIRSEIEKRHDESIHRFQDWVRNPSIAAEDRAAPIQAQIDVLNRAGIEPAIMPRIAGSYPGYVFTGEPLRLAAGHFGLGHGSGAHAPNEYFVIEPSNPNVADWDTAVASYAAYLFALAN